MKNFLLAIVLMMSVQPALWASEPWPDEAKEKKLSPIIISLSTSAWNQMFEKGETCVDFTPEPGCEWVEAWLTGGRDLVGVAGVLVRPKDGLVSGYKEWFGNFSPQDPSESPNGWLALSRHDSDSDGIITKADEIFEDLGLWWDVNRDGIGTPDEIRPLSPDLRIGLDAWWTGRRDRNGVEFRWASLVQVGAGVTVAYDVFFPELP